MLPPVCVCQRLSTLPDDQGSNVIGILDYQVVPFSEDILDLCRPVSALRDGMAASAAATAL